MAKNEAKIKFTAETSDFNSNIKKADLEISKLSAELRKNAAEMKNSGETTSKLKERQSTLTKELDQQKKKTEELNKKLQKAKEIYGEDSQEAKKLERQVTNSKTAEQKLETQLNETNGKLKENAKNFGLSAEKAEKLKKASEKLDKASKTAMKGVAAAATGAVLAFEQVDEGSDQVIKKTGATGESAKELKNIYKEVSGEIVGDFTDVGNAVGEVSTKFHLEGDALKEYSELFLKFANINETDVTSSIDNAYQASRKWNLSNEDTALLLEQITKKSQDTGLSVDDLFQQLNDGSAILKDMGLNANQSVEYLASLEESGINVSDGYKAMRFAIKNATEEGKNLDDFLVENYNAIKNAKTETEALSIATDTFGNKNAPEMTKAIREGRLKLDGFKNSAKGLAGTINSTYDETIDGTDRFKLALKNLEIGASEVGAEILTELEPHINNLVGWSKDAIKWVKANSKEIVSGLKTVGTVAGTVFAINKMAKVTQSFITIGGSIKGVISKVSALTAARVAETVATEAEAKATEELVIAQSATKYGVVLAGVTALIGGITALSFACTDTTEHLNEETIQTRKLLEENKNLQDELKNTESLRDDNITSAQEESTQAEILWEKIKELQAIEKKSNAQKNTMIELVEQLNEIYPDLNLKYDEENDKLNKSNKKIEKNIELKKQQALADAMYANAGDVISDISKVTVELEKQEEQQKKNIKANKEAHAASKKAQNEFRSYVKSIGGNPDNFDVRDYQVGGRKEDKEAVRLYGNMVDAAKKTGETQKTVDDLSASIINNKNRLKELNDEYEHYNNAADKIINKQDIEKAFNELAKQAKKQGIKIPKAVSDGIKQGQYAVPNSINALKNLIKYDEMMKDAEKAGIKVPKSITSGIATGKLKPKEAVEQMQRWITYQNMLAKAGLAGAKTPEAIKQGILSGKEKPADAIRQVRSSVSKISFFNTGQSIGGTFLNGFKTIYSGVTNFISSLTNPGNKNTNNKNPKHSAIGRIAEHEMLTWVAEDGPEAIIPINNARRSRELFLETGRRMGLIAQERSRSLGNQTLRETSNMAETNRLLTIIANKSNDMYVDSRRLEQSTADSRDLVDGKRNRLVQRGLAVR